MTEERLCAVTDIDPKLAIQHPRLDVPLLLTHVGEEILCIENTCPHSKKQNVSTGDIEDVGGAMCAICPRHKTRFKGGLCIDLKTGESKNKAGEALPYPPVAIFKCRVEDGDVFIGDPIQSESRPSSKSDGDLRPPPGAEEKSPRSEGPKPSRPSEVKRRPSSCSTSDPHKRLAALSKHANAPSAASNEPPARGLDFNAGVWKTGTVSYRKWLSPDLLEIRVEVDLELPPPGKFYHFYVEFEGVEREFTPAPGTKQGLAVLFIRIYLDGEFSQLADQQLKVKKEVRMCLESTFVTDEVPVGLVLAGTASLVAFHNLDIPHICSVRKDKEYEVYAKFGLKRIKITGPSPLKPEEPTDCCGEGCEVCVMDTYQEKLEKYEEMMERLRGRITAEDIASLPDGPIGISGPPSFIEQISLYLNGTHKKPLLLDLV